ncbi:uncharacterized protein LOC124444003 [Xenia sp. Carnegie-2017]|uniref:uncharacterized protein LOC124444003 n=1 Tax=Xenia sp. Carnegie-2017 TaxID=2897299 RepID=UPI001F03A315|nr:uncharacterized protein LOC124444003 [Xenia sp. Carnegie-2017]
MVSIQSNYKDMNSKLNPNTMEEYKKRVHESCCCNFCSKKDLKNIFEEKNVRTLEGPASTLERPAPTYTTDKGYPLKQPQHDPNNLEAPDHRWHEPRRHVTSNPKHNNGRRTSARRYD